jgi:DNA-binding GntR family transcriptional regulator
MIKKRTAALRHKICAYLRNEIVRGTIPPGGLVKEGSLAEKFKCSRGPVREALIQLEKEGFLELIPNQGAVVTKISPDEVKDFYALLEVLEGKAVQWATPHLCPEDIDRLVETNNAIRQISRESKTCVEDWIPLNLSFHRLFREKSGNSKLNWTVEEIRMRITRYRYTSLIVTDLEAYVRDHDTIIELARKGEDALGARKAMELHICHAKEALMAFLSRFPGF